ncbi:SDR family oxidoreductase [Microbacterium kribbense]|uniref:SDR family oxidoreductase n=1 Tax=Microbacterium kribbense TaxID=433645 RepID=A0ABP7GWX7_9MICO
MTTIPSPLFDVRGRVALVTGSSRGIGSVLARGLAQAGARVAINGRDPQAVADTCAMLEKSGCDVCAAAFDVTSPDGVAAGIDRIEEWVGPIDILVNNAGIQRRAHFTEFTDQDWTDLLASNLTSAFLVGRRVAASMERRGSGKVINIGSVQSMLGRPGIAAYAATKGAIAMLTKGMCADLAPRGIQVNSIAPGYFATELTQALVDDPEFSRWVQQRTPAGRWGRVEDLVGALLFLASPASDFVNGQVIYVDGGMTAVV